MSHALKVLLKIIHNRIYKKCEQESGYEQFGFKSGLGTREALFCLQLMAQKCTDQQKPMYVCFVDFEKAFDRVKHTRLIEMLYELGVDSKDVTLLKNIYWQQTAHMKIENDNSNPVNIQRGVRQGCVLSPSLFNVYSEAIFREAFSSTDCGIKVNGEVINNIRFADDTVLIADSDTGLQSLVERLEGSCKKYGMKINSSKTKVMVFGKNQNVPIPIKIEGNTLEQVYKFKYLGSWIVNTLNNDVEIKTRIEQARNAFLKMKNVFQNPRLDLELRTRLVKCYVWSILLYGAETWTLKVQEMNRLESFETWIYRRMLKIPWTAHITNTEVYNRIGRERELLNIIKIRKTSYLGHILRNEKYHVLQLIVKGKIEGKRGLGRKKLSWLRNIRNWTHLTFEELIRKAENREDFANVIANLHERDGT